MGSWTYHPLTSPGPSTGTSPPPTVFNVVGPRPQVAMAAIPLSGLARLVEWVEEPSAMIVRCSPPLPWPILAFLKRLFIVFVWLHCYFTEIHAMYEYTLIVKIQSICTQQYHELMVCNWHLYIAHPSAAECAFFSTSGGTYLQTDHTLSCKTHLNKLKKWRSYNIWFQTTVELN